MNNWRRTCLGILLAPFLLLLLLIVGTSLHAGWRHGHRLLSIQWVARQFGYSADRVSVQGRGCDNHWIDGADCTLFLVFTSAQSLDEVKQAAQGRYLNARGRTETVQELFQAVNYRTSHLLTLDGDAAIGENAITPTVAVERISGWDDASAPRVIFYVTQQLHSRLMLDHTPLDSNLILIEYPIGRISSLALFYWLFTPPVRPHNSPIVNWLLAAAPATGPALVVDLRENVYHPGESVSFTTAFVNDHALLPNAQITVTLLTPDGQTTHIPTTHNAYQVDGKPSHAVHTVKFPAPTVGGRALLRVRASNETLVDETETEIFFVPIPKFARVEQVIAERALDSNHDSYLEGIDIDLLVTIYTANAYKARAWLSDQEHRTLVSASTEFLSPPEQTLPNVKIVTLRFSGPELHDAQMGGPYTLGAVTLASRLEIKQVGNTPLPKPKMVWWDETFVVPHTTAAYTVDQFARQPVVQTQDGTTVINSTDHVHDLNGDGLYDRLTISVTVAPLTPGTYSWSGQLVDQAGRFVTQMSGKGNLGEQAVVPFIFPGWAIRQAGLVAPFHLNIQDLRRVGGKGSALQSLGDVHTTQSYSLTQFSPAYFLTTSEEAVDADHDGRYERLVLRLVPDLPFASRYEYRSRFTDSNGGEIQLGKQTGELGGTAPIVLALDGNQLHAGQHDGPYILRDLQIMQEYNDNIDYHYTNAYTTTSYLATQFEQH